MTSIKDDRGYNQIFGQSEGNLLRLRRRADWMIEEMQPGVTKKILEIGCGTGYVANYIAQQTQSYFVGADLCIPFIEEAKKKYTLSNLRFEAFDFNLATERGFTDFDFIIGNGILHHLYYNLEEAISNFRKILNPGGKIIFMEPNIYNPYVAAIFKINKLRKMANLEPDEMAFSKNFISNLLKKNDFTNIKIKYKDFLLPGIPMWLIKPSIAAGNFLEKTPFRFVSQSILISAEK